jgi:hypothetical protein
VHFLLLQRLADEVREQVIADLRMGFGPAQVVEHIQDFYIAQHMIQHRILNRAQAREHLMSGQPPRGFLVSTRDVYNIRVRLDRGDYDKGDHTGQDASSGNVTVAKESVETGSAPPATPNAPATIRKPLDELANFQGQVVRAASSHASTCCGLHLVTSQPTPFPQPMSTPFPQTPSPGFTEQASGTTFQPGWQLASHLAARVPQGSQGPHPSTTGVPLDPMSTGQPNTLVLDMQRPSCVPALFPMPQSCQARAAHDLSAAQIPPPRAAASGAINCTGLQLIAGQILPPIAAASGAIPGQILPPRAAASGAINCTGLQLIAGQILPSTAAASGAIAGQILPDSTARPDRAPITPPGQCSGFSTLDSFARAFNIPLLTPTVDALARALSVGRLTPAQLQMASLLQRRSQLLQRQPPG